MSNSASGEAAKAVVRRNTEEVQGKGNFAVFDELFADDYVDHTPQPGGTPDKPGTRGLYQGLREAFPDFHAVIHWQTVDGEIVTTFKTYYGTHLGTFLGVAPTGRKIHFESVDAMRVHNGKITDHWGVGNLFSLMQQLGGGPPFTREGVGGARPEPAQSAERRRGRAAMTFHDRAIVLRPGEGKTVSVFGDPHTFKAVGEQTEGAYGLVEIALRAPASGPPAHVHRDADEAFYVLEGELTMLIGDRTITATAGSFAFVPRGTVHTFANRGTHEARFLVITSPAGLERALEEVAEFAPSAGQPPDIGRLLAIAEKYNTENVGPPLA